MNDTSSNSRPSGRRGSSLVSVVLLVVFAQLFFGMYLLQGAIDQRFGEYRATEEVLYVESGETLKRILLGFDNLAADLYWLRTVQYYGGKRLYDPEKRYDLLAPLLEITTSLDPRFKIAYSYGATFLSEPWPSGAGLPLEGLQLIDKGIENNPDHWRFYLDKGFIYYWCLQDYQKAAEVFLEGQKVPGAPYWMSTTAARTLTRGGDRETARHLWTILRDTAEFDQMRWNAEIHLKQLDALDEIDVLTTRVREYAQSVGHFPGSWEELLKAGVVSAIPADPTGVPYVLNPRLEKVQVSTRSELAGLPVR